MRTLVLIVLSFPALASAQFVTDKNVRERPAGEKFVETETDYKVRLSLGATLYSESQAAVEAAMGGPPAPPLDGSTDRILYTDLRARVEAIHIEGSAWSALGDLRLRLAQDPDDPLDLPEANRPAGSPPSAGATGFASRGFLGGPEYDIKELYFGRAFGKLEIAFGRHIIRDVDATTVDGVRAEYKVTPVWSGGAFAGLYPDPYSRSITSDYQAISDSPAAAGAWAGYGYREAHGALGVGAVLPRETDPATAEPTRVFLTSTGYYDLPRNIDVYHVIVGNVAGRSGPQFHNAHALAQWAANERLRLELGAGFMSTYALELYVRDYLESPQPPLANAVQNNLTVVRMGSQEVRAGANYVFPKQRIDVFGQVRFRRRDTLTYSNLPVPIANLPADEMIDVSAGARQRDSVKEWDFGVNAATIRGDRSTSIFATVTAANDFFSDKLELEADAGIVQFRDECELNAAMMAVDPTCTGKAFGLTLRGGFTVGYHPSRKWLVFADYHFARMGTKITGAMTQPKPILSHTALARAQYSF